VIPHTGRFKGAIVSEQRSSAVTSFESVQSHVVSIEKGELPMKVKNNSETPQLSINWKHISLVILHFVIFVFLVFDENFINKEVAAGALP
jgi:hypothetical protein